MQYHAAPLCPCASCRIAGYDKYFAFNMATGMREYEEGLAPVKRQLFGKVPFSGAHVLEIGMGTGPNLQYYGSKVRRLSAAAAVQSHRHGLAI